MPKVQTLKGFRDITPEEALKRGRVLALLKSVFKTYGFVPLETPTLEYAELLEGKYGDEEKLIYKFKDRGGREAALRFDLTVPLARFVAENKGKLIFPFKRYQIGNAFRAEKPQAGRYREFTQVDIDTVGVNSTLADAEILAIIATALQLLGIKKFTILINDRNIFKGVSKKAIQILDKWDKIGQAGVKKELQEAGFEAGKILRRAQDKKPTPRLQEIFSLLKSFGISEDLWEFNPLLARGLDYYTGVVFEVKVPNYKGSIAGGGRYDDMIGIFTSEKIPAVGVSIGLDRLVEVTPEKTLSEIPFRPQVLVTIFSPKLTPKTIELFDQIQAAGIETELYLDPQAKLDKQLKYADKKEIPYALILGPEEVRAGEVTLKDLKKGTQKTLSPNVLIKLLT
jgi:histidyl-tRNA synthetase